MNQLIRYVRYIRCVTRIERVAGYGLPTGNFILQKYRREKNDYE